MTKILNILIIVAMLTSLILLIYYRENKPDEVLSLYNLYSNDKNFNCEELECFNVENESINNRQVIVTRRIHTEFRRYYISFRDYRSHYDSYYSFDEKKLYFDVTIDNYEFSGNYNVKKEDFEIENKNPYTTNEEILNYYETLEAQIKETSLNVINIIKSDISESYESN